MPGWLGIMPGMACCWAIPIGAPMAGAGIPGAAAAGIPAAGPPIMPMLMRFLRRSSVGIAIAGAGGARPGIPAGAVAGACVVCHMCEPHATCVVCRVVWEWLPVAAHTGQERRRRRLLRREGPWAAKTAARGWWVE
jgi:hypothetical protein